MKVIDIAKKIGSGFAYIQAFLDDVVIFLFKKLRSSGEEKKKRWIFKDNSKKARVLSFFKACARFLGGIGESFYEKYEQIKAEKRRKKTED